jgi:hypothetical protein
MLSMKVAIKKWGSILKKERNFLAKRLLLSKKRSKIYLRD